MLRPFARHARPIHTGRLRQCGGWLLPLRPRRQRRAQTIVGEPGNHIVGQRSADQRAKDQRAGANRASAPGSSGTTAGQLGGLAPLANHESGEEDPDNPASDGLHTDRAGAMDRDPHQSLPPGNRHLTTGAATEPVDPTMGPALPAAATAVAPTQWTPSDPVDQSL